MHAKQYSSLGQAILSTLETVAEKIWIPCSHAKKIRMWNLRFWKIHLRERFRKASLWGPSVFKKLRIRADTCDRFYVSGVEKLRFRKDSGTCARTVVSGAEERGVNGPSLDRSYFSRLQPISFLFFDPSSSHIAKLVARIRYSISMLHTHATHARTGKRPKSISTRRRGVVSKSAMPLEKSPSQQTLFACSSELNFPARGRSYF